MSSYFWATLSSFFFKKKQCLLLYSSHYVETHRNRVNDLKCLTLCSFVRLLMSKWWFAKLSKKKKIEKEWKANTHTIHRTRKTTYTHHFDWQATRMRKKIKYILYTIIKFVFRCWGFYFVLTRFFFLLSFLLNEGKKKSSKDLYVLQ